RIGAGRAATLDVPEVGGTKTIDVTTIAISRTMNGRKALPRMVGEGERDNNHFAQDRLGRFDGGCHPAAKIKYDASVENDARLDRGVGRPLVDPNRPHGAVTVGGGAPSLALVRMPTLRFCPAGLEATGNAAGERRSPSGSWGTGRARKAPDQPPGRRRPPKLIPGHSAAERLCGGPARRAAFGRPGPGWPRDIGKRLARTGSAPGARTCGRPSPAGCVSRAGCACARG